MSMYTQLLTDALEQKRRTVESEDRRVALDEARRCRRDLDDNVPPGMEPDRLPVVLARQIGYDVALLQLAQRFGIETDPNRFDRPGSERVRLEALLNDRGVRIDDVPAAESNAVPGA
jgi:hypothetical protein